jgi:Patatin-like phospholipase
MRAAIIIPILLGTSGCMHLDAKPLSFTCGLLLSENIETYRPTRIIAQIQQDAGLDDLPEGASLAPANTGSPNKYRDDNLVAALRSAPAKVALDGGQHTMLMLSGGGSWGAFGAGFLHAHKFKNWTSVAGISTGALQGVLVAAGDYDRLVKEYTINREEDLARKNSIFSIARNGSQYDIAPLREKVMGYLVDTSGGATPLGRIAEPSAPQLFVGMVEANSGDLKVVAISKMVRSVFGRSRAPSSVEINALADCVAGVTIASSSIPVRLTPVQIDGRTYMDGGVRSSVFEAGLANRIAEFGKNENVTPEIFVIRNGPTIVFRDKLQDGTKIPKVDARPDIARVGMRGYSTIVNQSELMSIASLRLNYPTGPISVITADGFNSKAAVACGPRPGAAFDPVFMKCLIKWGKQKADAGPKWIKLEDLALMVKTNTF